VSAEGEGPSRFLGESDWDEQDLLTLDEAGERLRVEIAATQRSLEELRRSGASDPAVVSAVTARLEALRTCMESVAAGPSPKAQI
jgi:hypothetical protein